MSRRPLLVLGVAVMLAVPGVSSFAQTDCNKGAGPLRSEQPANFRQDEIVARLAANEARFSAAQMKYTYTEDISVQTLDMGDYLAQPRVDGEFRLVAKVSYDAKGKRIEEPVFAPQPTLRRISLSPQDMEDVRTFMGFPLTTQELPKYNFHFAGQQKVDELETYAFDVAPKTIVQGQRYFQGRVWVDKDDNVIVKTCGKSVPDVVAPTTKKKKKKGVAEENIQPKFVSYRELIDGQYWFPTYTRSDDVLRFTFGQEVQLREVIKFKDYKRADAKPQAGGSARTETKAAH